MVYKIVKYPDPVLEKRGEPVTDFGTPELRQFVDDMFETMYRSKGVGLAAPQVGVSQQVTVIDVSGGEGDPQKIVLINPEIVFKGRQADRRGRLPEHSGVPVRRDAGAEGGSARARRGRYAKIELEGLDLLARAMQHEIDHLHGILFLTHLSPLKRDLVKRRIKKLIKEGEWD